MAQLHEYPLGRSAAETRRLVLQHQVYGPLTERFFRAAGIGRGMKVLDLGSGAGDVALLLAGLVGPRGRVVGVDLNEGILETARARTEAVGWRNVTFLSGDVRELRLDDDFDAVVGRWVLMYVPEPAALLRSVTALLRPGGIVAFHENDFTYPPTVFPPTELSRRIQDWMLPPPGAPAPEMHMGTKLYRTYLEAGLPGPELMLEAAVGGGPDWPGYELVAETLRSLLPMLTRAGFDASAVGLDTLAARMRDDVVAHRAVHMMPLMFGAWARSPR